MDLNDFCKRMIEYKSLCNEYYSLLKEEPNWVEDNCSVEVDENLLLRLINLSKENYKYLVVLEQV